VDRATAWLPLIGPVMLSNAPVRFIPAGMVLLSTKTTPWPSWALGSTRLLLPIMIWLSWVDVGGGCGEAGDCAAHLAAFYDGVAEQLDVLNRAFIDDVFGQFAAADGGIREYPNI